VVKIKAIKKIHLLPLWGLMLAPRLRSDCWSRAGKVSTFHSVRTCLQEVYEGNTEDEEPLEAGKGITIKPVLFIKVARDLPVSRNWMRLVALLEDFLELRDQTRL